MTCSHVKEKFNLKKRQDVRNLNKISEVLPEIEKLSLDITILKNVNDLTSNKYLIVNTNVVKLLLLNLYKHLQEKDRSLLDARNVFTTPEIMKKFPDSRQVLMKTKPLHVLVDCTKHFDCSIKDLIVNKISKFIFVVKCEASFDLVRQTLEQERIAAVEMIEIFSWSDLSQKTKNILLQTKVQFQGCFISLLDLIPNVMDTDDQNIARDVYEEVIDDHLLNLLVDKVEILLNSKFRDEITDKNFKILFQPRKFLKIQTNPINQKSSDKEKSITSIISQEQLLESIKNEKPKANIILKVKYTGHTLGTVS